VELPPFYYQKKRGDMHLTARRRKKK